MENEIIKSAVDHITKQENELFKEALKRKGWDIPDDEMEAFIFTQCRCEEYKPANKRIYYVKDQAFLVHKYSPHHTRYKVDAGTWDRTGNVVITDVGVYELI